MNSIALNDYDNNNYQVLLCYTDIEEVTSTQPTGTLIVRL